MADTKKGRERQARDADNRQRAREIEQERGRGDEREPPQDDQDETTTFVHEETDDPGSPRECHRRDCTEPARFVVLERYQEETGHGAVEAEALLCEEHTAEESPTNLDNAYSEYVFRVDPLSETTTVREEG